MGVNPIAQMGGVSRAKVDCDLCERSEVVACEYVKGSHNSDRVPNESQARAKVMGMGWTYIKNKLRCPACEAKRKVVQMPIKEVKAETPREPTKRQRIDIFTMLAEVYDIDAGRYMQGDTDDTIAEVLGVMPGWVAKIREADFGPDGGNESIEALSEQIEAMVKEIEGIRGDCRAIHADCKSIMKAADVAINSAERKLAEVSAMRADLERIKKAVGPRILKQA
jgi:rubredoxin